MRPPFIEKQNATLPPWSAEEDVDILLRDETAGEGRSQLRLNVNNNYPQRDRGTNHDKSFGAHEEELIIKLHATIGSRWTIIAQQLPGRTESEVKNCWNTKLKKRLTEMGIDPVTHKPFSQVLRDYGNIGGNARVVGNTNRVHHSKDLRNSSLSNSNSKSQQQQRFTPIQFHARPSKAPAPAMMLNSLLSPIPKSSAESMSWADFLVRDEGFWGDHIPNEATGGGLPFSLSDDTHGILAASENAVECPSSSDSFVEALLNKHKEMFMDFPEIWDESAIH